MPTFTYLIRTADGHRKEGKLEAQNIAEASEILSLDNQVVVRLNEKDTSFDFLGPFIDRLQAAITRMRVRVKLNTLVFFTRQLATMFSAGLTIERSLHFLSTEEKNNKFRKILNTIEKNIRKGLLLSDALERHPGVFSNLYISLVRAGEVSGKLSETLTELALYLEMVSDTQRKVKSALYYPVFMLFFLFAMLLFTFTFIIPKFSEVYASLGSNLPFYTLVLVQISSWIKSNFIFVTFMTIASFVSFWLFTLTDFGRLAFDRFLLRIPVLGNLIKQNILSKFSKTFGILLSAGVSVLESMELVTRVVDNRLFELAIQKAAKDIENGIGISRALKDTATFPPIIIQLISTGEETGEIDKLALKASDFYTKQVNAIVERLTSILEPILLLLVAVIIGMIVIATYLPIFHFGEALAQ